MVNTAEREKEKGKPTQSAKKKSLGQTLVPPCKVTARRLIFKQVLKLQILIGAADSTELFHQIFFVVKGGHLSIFFLTTPLSSHEAAGTWTANCGVDVDLGNLLSIHASVSSRR